MKTGKPHQNGFKSIVLLIREMVLSLLS